MRKSCLWTAAAAALVTVGSARGAFTYSGVTLSAIGVSSGFGSVTVATDGSSPLYTEAAQAGYTVGYGQTTSTNTPTHALLWPGAGLAPIDLNPAGSANNVSKAYATSGSQQVGVFANDPTGKGQFITSNAMLWARSAASAVNLNPTGLNGITQSVAYGTDGVHQVGYGFNTSGSRQTHATLWSGTAGSAVDLHPAGFFASQADAVGGGQEVGIGYQVDNGLPTALLWSGSAASVVALQPTNISGFLNSAAYGVANGQQVGGAFDVPTGNKPNSFVQSHAVLWGGTAASAVDLNPTGLSGINQSLATATNGARQAGIGYTDGNFTAPRAVTWSGSAASAVDLQSLLPSDGAWTVSRATAVDGAGNVFGTATGTGGTYAVEWLPTTIAATVVNGGQSYQFPTDAPVQAVAGLTVAGGGVASIIQASSTASRQLAVVAGNGLSLGGSTGAWTGKFDVANNDLDLPGASLVTVTSQLAQGYAGGTWNGSGGITSATAAADVNHLSAIGVIQNATAAGAAFYTTFDGQAVTPSDVLAKYTLYGDTNLDGVVDEADYTRIDAGYLSGGKLTGWANGDFNYDGVVDGSDYALMDNAFNAQAAMLSGQPAATAAPMVANAVAEVAVVPEPSAPVAAALAGFAGLLHRRRPGRRPTARP